MSSPHVMSGRSCWSCYVVLYHPTSVTFDLIFVTSRDAILREAMSYRSREVIVIFFQVIFMHVIPCCHICCAKSYVIIRLSCDFMWCLF